MATEKATKTKAPAKPKKATTTAKKTTTKLELVPPSREEIARLAEKFWIERGRPEGSPEQDWLRAERELMGMAS
jgi:Protein of unknown function (DUF2934)